MNNSMYDDYMRSVLGYEPIDYRNTYNMNFSNYNMMPNEMSFSNTRDEEIERCYPDIYTLVYPMVQKVCMQNTRPITKQRIDEMTNEVYFAIDDNEIGEVRGKTSNQNQTVQGDNKSEDRVIRNNTLNDLIRILILRELLGRPGFPGMPPRPRPPRPPMRPPMRPRGDMGAYNNREYFASLDDRYDLYEY